MIKAAILVWPVLLEKDADKRIKDTPMVKILVTEVFENVDERFVAFTLSNCIIT